MFKKILIANRGEIAVRIIRACREMGISTVAVYSEADATALHTMLADEAVCIGPSNSKDSYLNIENIISATVLKGAEAIHPGFGFMAESSRFASICNECNIKFIGPESEVIDLMGDKAKAKDFMRNSGVRVIPGFEGDIKNEEEALAIAKDIGFPIMIKASNGGGGKGIRIVKSEEELKGAYNLAKAEAEACFGDSSLYIEKFIENPHHIEVQILADEKGNVIHLGERECSIQRKNQKVLEESPSPFISEDLRKELGIMAVRAAKAAKYTNAGTIEFLVDGKGIPYFMEMNTRIQVEHPVTEMVTGVDIVKEQINIAYGRELSFKQEDIKIKGHAIECRINAEDPNNDYRPCPGKIQELLIPGGPGIRIDSAIYQDYTIPPFYDSMLAKLIVYGRNREEAIMKMKRALSEFVIGGIKNNIELQFEILCREDFIKGIYDTSFLNRK
ncbi:acetyl-CoA carboxylase biotin carboxylase subunit [Clostridium sp. MSJ-4]|uniref:Biotin carboxylase n=1 Tax=Clostridium simiarum TaxID=2841506 RepID=A0ABS6EZ71_9CLOT|nr:acetyl-CoA carboxylase biotin carboxylase subunit [Clostridium simiarum]MBU5590949.1 acetyl-CoA carboxylase biotin carboxylase subunit [Clostridium simiarum]